MTLRQRLRYRFDNLLARGTWATLVWLGIITLTVVVVSGLLLSLFGVGLSGSQDASLPEEVWQSMLRVIDAGTMAGDTGWGRRILALAITIFGILVAGTLIGVIAAGVEGRIDRMRRGRSVVAESGHVVVLGDSERLPTLIRQLVLARAGRSRSVIVVMSDGDPAELQEQVRRVVTDRMGSRLVFRSGDPTLRSDLRLVRLDHAEAVIVLAGNDDSDARTIKTVIAVQMELADADGVRVVVELTQPETAVGLARAFTAGVHPIAPVQALARIASLALREVGAGQVALALLDDEGSDIHIGDASGLEGRTFGELSEMLLDARPIGRMRADGSTELNPFPATRLEDGDRLVVVSNLSNTWSRSGATGETQRSIASTAESGAEPGVPDQHMLVLGWSDLGAAMLHDWAGVASASSTAEVLFDPDILDAEEILLPDFGSARFEMAPSPALPDLTSRLAASPAIDTILLLGYPTRLDEEHSDTVTLLNLLAARRVIESNPGPPARLLVELQDVDNIPLAELHGPDDLLISQAITSQLIAQLVEHPERRAVFLDLYDPDTASIHLIPARSLGLVGRMRAGDIYRTGHTAGLTLIGWQRSADGTRDLVLNAHQSTEVDLADDDRLIVIG